MHRYQICSRCIMDTSAPDISFDTEGVCNFCRRYDDELARLLPHGQSSESELHRAAARMKRTGAGLPFDAIIGLSGGLDSTYAAYIGSRAGLRLLGIHVDNGWNTPLAVANLEGVAEKLAIPLETISPSWEEFRDLQLAFLKSGIANIEIPTDHVIAAALYEAAARHGIRYLLSGSNLASEGIMPPSYGYHHRDLRFIRAIHRQFGTRQLKSLPTIGIRRTLYYRYIKGIRRVRILNLVPYVRNDAAALMTDKVGWKDYGAKHYESLFTRFFQGYILPSRFGIDKRRPHLSSLVCSGQITRSEALARVAASPYPSEELRNRDEEMVLQRLGLSKAEFDGLMALPIKTIHDYPSHEALFRLAVWFSKRGLRIAE